MSCEACQQIFYANIQLAEADSVPLTADREQYRSHHADISGLCQSALDQCRICIDLWRYFFRQKTPQEYVKDPFFYNGNDFFDSETVHVFWHSGTSFRFVELSQHYRRHDDVGRDAFMIEFDLNSPMEKDLKPYAYIVQRSSASEEASLGALMSYHFRETASGTMAFVDHGTNGYEKTRWDRIRKWVSECDKTHTTCRRQSRESGRLPSRVICVPLREPVDNSRISLIDTKRHDPNELRRTYVTLSHCWGPLKNPSYRTTRQNLETRLKDGILWQDLPLTFKDAINVARRLHVSYIWIDSICIVQGDEEDWQIESADMSNVYANAYLNISATSATSSQDGLNSSHELHPRLLEVVWQGDRSPGRYRLVDLNFWRTRVSDAVVNTRGWVVQERLLARRVLHYTFDQVAWECCEMSAAEEFPSSIPKALQDVFGSFKQQSTSATRPMALARPGSLASTSSRQADAHDSWGKILRQYGRSDFTVPDQDKLVAISGLVKALHDRSQGDEYLAGIWRSNIYAGLLWEVQKGRRLIHGFQADGMYTQRHGFASRAKTYRAPSWSWASVDGLILTWGYMDVSGKPTPYSEGSSYTTTPCAEILEVRVTPARIEAPFGQVKDGVLIVHGRLYRYAVENPRHYGKRTVFRANGDWAVLRGDEQIPWDVLDKAWFLPLILRTWSCGDQLPSFVKSRMDDTVELDKSFLERWPPDKKARAKQLAEAKDWTTEEARTWDDMQSLKNNGFNFVTDLIEGIVIVPSEDGKSFGRIGRASMGRSTIHRLDDLAGLCRWQDQDEVSVRKSSSTRITSSQAVDMGDVVQGVFDIV